MRFACFLMLCFCIGLSDTIQAQAGHEPDTLLANANELLGSNPDQSITIGQHLLKNSLSNSKKSEANLLIAKAFLAKGDYNHSLDYVFRAGNSATADDPKIGILIFKAAITRELQLDDESRKYAAKAKTAATQLNASDSKLVAEGKLLEEDAFRSIQKNDNQKAFQSLYKAKGSYLKMKTPEKADLLAFNDIAFGKVFARINQPDSAMDYFKKALDYFQRQKTQNLLGKSTAQLEFAKLYFLQKDNKQAEMYLLQALQSAEMLQNLPLQKDINKWLSLNGLSLGDREKFNQYNRKFIQLSNIADKQEIESTNTAFNLISREQESQTALQEEKYRNILNFTLLFLLLIAGFGSILFFRNRARKRRYTEIVKYLEISRSNSFDLVAAKKEAPKNLAIPPETEQQLLAKLKKFEASTRFTSKEMSLALLSAQLETNTKYLSEIINRQYHDNFNTYINKLRINYIIGKMKSDPAYLNYKISYLAEDCGFSSHSSFATVFKSITGIAPTTFIDFLSAEIKNKKIPV